MRFGGAFAHADRIGDCSQSGEEAILSVASAHALYLIGVVDADDPLRVAGDDAVDEEPDEGSGSDQE